MRHYVPTLHPKRAPIVGYCFNYNCLKLTSLLFQLTCKFIHTSYDNTTLANAYFMSLFLSVQTLYYIITLLWNTASTAQTQTSFHAIFLFSHIKVSVSFTF